MFKTTTNDDGTLTITKYTGTRTDVVIPEIIEGLQVTKIGRCAFCKEKITGTISPAGIICDCGTVLTSVLIPDSVTSIGEFAFAYNPLLTSVIISNSATVIGDSAFDGCRLKSVVLPANIVNFADNAFEYNLAAYYESQGRKAGIYTFDWTTLPSDKRSWSVQ